MRALTPWLLEAKKSTSPVMKHMSGRAPHFLGGGLRVTPFDAQGLLLGGCSEYGVLGIEPKASSLYFPTPNNLGFPNFPNTGR